MFFLPLEPTGTVWAVLQAMERKDKGKDKGKFLVMGVALETVEVFQSESLLWGSL